MNMEQVILNLISMLDIQKDAELLSLLYTKYASIVKPRKEYSITDIPEADIGYIRRAAFNIMSPISKNNWRLKKIDKILSRSFNCDSCRYSINRSFFKYNREITFNEKTSCAICLSCGVKVDRLYNLQCQIDNDIKTAIICKSTTESRLVSPGIV